MCVESGGRGWGRQLNFNESISLGVRGTQYINTLLILKKEIRVSAFEKDLKYVDKK